MTKFQRLIPSALLAGAILAGPAGPGALAEGGIKLGVLTCNSVSGTWRTLLIHSSVDVRCVFDGIGGREFYRGQTGIDLGVDLNWRSRQTMSFVVLGGASDLRRGAYALAGRYYGAKASATVGVGAGAAALIGGGAKSVSLQPLAIEGNTGFGAAAGIGYLSLAPDTKG